MANISDHLTQNITHNLERVFASQDELKLQLVNQAEALRRAQAVASGQIKGPLAGATFVVDDNLLLAGGSSTAVGSILDDYRSPFSAEVVQRLEAAGAICVGQTTDPAAAVASSLVVFAIGIDSSGSLRAAADQYQIYGAKPTYGAVSRYGAILTSSSMDTVSCLARSANDLASALEVMAGQDPKDMSSLENFFKPSQLSSSLRAALVRYDQDDSLAEAVTKDLTGRLSQNGHQVADIRLDSKPYVADASAILTAAEASSNLARYDGVRYGRRAEARTLDELYLKSRSQGLDYSSQLQIMLGNYVLTSDNFDKYYVQAARLRSQLAQELKGVFEQADVLVMISGSASGYQLSQLASLVGLPAVSLPMGESASVQLAGPERQDAKVLALAGQMTGGDR